MHWSSVLSAGAGLWLSLPMGVLVSECSRQSSPYEAGVRQVTQAEEVLVRRTVSDGAHATVARTVAVDEAGDNPRLFTVLHWQQDLALPWLRLELPGHSEVVHLALDNDGTLVAQLNSIHVRLRPVRKSVLKQ